MTENSSKTMEIRWHGRGGQGAKTACLLLAEAAFFSGKYVQGFPEYGPERMGAPITAYNRISDEPCSVHSNIYYPDHVVVVDETLLRTVDVLKGLKDGGILIINTRKTAGEIRELLPEFEGPVCVVDAERISTETLGRNFPNTPMLAAVVKASGVLDLGQFVSDMRRSFEHKFHDKPEVIEGNMKALQKTLDEVEVE
ncbi:MAG: 2-oxoacid:acceptor oxidoreductase family protein [Firmicutes bacterium]|nr:2-oxoacid:acceptor oxidoreductase family protein [Bacillota bacterium]